MPLLCVRLRVVHGRAEIFQENVRASGIDDVTDDDLFLGGQRSAAPGDIRFFEVYNIHLVRQHATMPVASQGIGEPAA
jgi:hypothetical protein